jgi:WD40 repeat protein
MKAHFPDFNELDRLVYKWCEGDITAEEGRRLESLLVDPAARQYFLDCVQLDAQLTWELDEEGGRIESHPAVPAGWRVRSTVGGHSRAGARRRRVLLAGGMVAAVAVAVAAGFWFLRPPRADDDGWPAPVPAAVAEIQSLWGTVDIVGHGGSARPAAAGETIHASESIRTGLEEGHAVVECRRGARIDMGPDTELCFDSKSDPDGAADLVQRRGTITLAVAKQPADHPLVLRTPHGTIRVLGTRFQSLVGPDATLVETEQGCVEVTRASDRQRAEVGEGDYVLVGSSQEPLTVRAAPITLTEATRVLEDRQSDEHVSALSFAPDGATLWTGGTRGFLRIWDVKMGEVRRRIPAHKSLIRSLLLAPDGRTFATAGEDHRIRFWDARTCEQLPQEIRPRVITSPLAFCDGGSLLAVHGRVQGTRTALCFWRCDNGEHVADLTLGVSSLSCVALSPDGRTLAAGDEKGNVVLCDARQRRELKTFEAHDKNILAIAFSPDGRWLATGGKDALVKLWDRTDWRLRATLRGHVRDVVSLAFCPDRQLLATSDNAGITRVWDLPAGREAVVISWPRFREARTVFTPDGRSVVTAGTRGIIKFWHLPDDVRESSAAWSLNK